MINLHPEFKEFLKLLNGHQVDYLLVGGYAVSIHGYFRYTADIDFWVANSEENADKIVCVLKEFGFDVPNLSPELFLDGSRMTRLGREPVKIEILNSVSGLNFESAKAGAETCEIDEISIPVISLSDLRKNKQASGRAKDIADLENLPLA